jgi:hypothetical protein
MLTRGKEYYDIVAKGLASLGYVGTADASAFDLWVNDMFAEKYNAEQTFAQMGFPLNPNIPINPTYEQVEATIRPYTMGAYVDIDSDGPTKSTDGFALKTGGLPTFKHEIVLNRKIVREKMMLAAELGKTTPEMENIVMQLLFNGVDSLLGGNYNTFRNQRNRIVSNQAKLVVDKTNNPLGIALEIDFGVPTKNIKTSKWYKRDKNGVATQNSTVGTSIIPIEVMQDVKENAELVDFAGPGHWECSKKTWRTLYKLDYFKVAYVVANRPDISDADQKLAFGKTVTENAIKAFIEDAVGAKISVIDDKEFIEKYNTETRKIDTIEVPSFNDDVLVYVPDGAMGDVQCGKPLYMETPGARVALYDGGRTLLRQVFNDENMVQVIKSEVTGLVVPNKTRHMYYLYIEG